MNAIIGVKIGINFIKRSLNKNVKIPPIRKIKLGIKLKISIVIVLIYR